MRRDVIAAFVFFLITFALLYDSKLFSRRPASPFASRNESTLSTSVRTTILTQHSREDRGEAAQRSSTTDSPEVSNLGRNDDDVVDSVSRLTAQLSDQQRQRNKHFAVRSMCDVFKSEREKVVVAVSSELCSSLDVSNLIATRFAEPPSATTLTRSKEDSEQVRHCLDRESRMTSEVFDALRTSPDKNARCVFNEIRATQRSLEERQNFAHPRSATAAPASRPERKRSSASGDGLPLRRPLRNIVVTFYNNEGGAAGNVIYPDERMVLIKSFLEHAHVSSELHIVTDHGIGWQRAMLITARLINYSKRTGQRHNLTRVLLTEIDRVVPKIEVFHVKSQMLRQSSSSIGAPRGVQAGTNWRIWYFALYLKELMPKRIPDCDSTVGAIITVDGRDTLFQADPFLPLFTQVVPAHARSRGSHPEKKASKASTTQHNGFLFATAEHPQRLYSSRMNRQWLSDFLGSEEANLIIYNSTKFHPRQQPRNSNSDSDSNRAKRNNALRQQQPARGHHKYNSLPGDGEDENDPDPPGPWSAATRKLPSSLSLPIICSGLYGAVSGSHVTPGGASTGNSAVRILLDFLSLMRKLLDCSVGAHGLDQGAAQVIWLFAWQLLHQPPKFSVGAPFLLLDPMIGPYRHMIPAELLNKFPQHGSSTTDTSETRSVNVVANCLNEPYAILHQFDRHDGWKKHVQAARDFFREPLEIDDGAQVWRPNPESKASIRSGGSRSHPHVLVPEKPKPPPPSPEKKACPPEICPKI